MAVDGTDERRLTNSPQPEESPDWGRNPGPATVGGTVPATLALSLAGPVSLGTLHPGHRPRVHGLDHRHRHLDGGVRDAERLRPGPPDQRRLHARAAAPSGDDARGVERPVSNATVADHLQQAIGATDPLRTGTYTKTLTFTLATTEP